MIESCLRIVHVPANQTMTTKNATRSSLGHMAILLHGKCVNRSNDIASVNLSAKSEHYLHEPEESDSVKSRGSVKRMSSRRSSITNR